MLVRTAHRQSGEFLETTSIEVYGSPNDATLEMIRQLSSAGVRLTVKPHEVAGFTRSAAEQAPVAP